MPRTCVVRLLGGFLVEIDGVPIPADEWRHRRGADLVKLLALSRQHRLHKEEVMDALWPGLGENAAAGNLRKSVHYARRAMTTMEAIKLAGDLLVLWPSGPLRVDADDAEKMAASALGSRVGLDAASDLLGRELLPEDRYAEWTASRRERLRHKRLELLRAQRRWDQVLEMDPSDEEACRALMRAHIAAGDRKSAIRQFQRLREVLRVDLGVAPEPETVALFEAAVAVEGLPHTGPVESVQALLARGLLHWNQRELDSAQRLADEAPSARRRASPGSRAGRSQRPPRHGGDGSRSVAGALSSRIHRGRRPRFCGSAVCLRRASLRGRSLDHRS